MEGDFGFVDHWEYDCNFKQIQNILTIKFFNIKDELSAVKMSCLQQISKLGLFKQNKELCLFAMVSTLSQWLN